MNKLYVPLLAASLTLAGCATPQRGSVPVVDAGAPLSAGGSAVREPQPSSVQSLPQDSGVVVMVPQGGTPAPIQAGAAPLGAPAITPGPITADPTLAGSWGAAAGASAPR